jgi:hypothetical protein
MWDVKVRVVAEINYLKPADTMQEKVNRRLSQYKVDAMARGLEDRVEQMLADQINAEIDLAKASFKRATA